MDTEVQQQKDTLPPHQSKPFPFSKLILIMIVLGIVIIGISIGFFMSNNQSTVVTTNTPTIHPTNIPTAIPTLRPTDPVINEKRLYSTKGFGMTFEYPKDWKIVEEINYDDYTGTGKYRSVKFDSGFVIGNRFDRVIENGKTLFSQLDQMVIDDRQARITAGIYCGYLDCNTKYGEIHVEIIGANANWYVNKFYSSNDDKFPTQEIILSDIKVLKELLSTIQFTQ